MSTRQNELRDFLKEVESEISGERIKKLAGDINKFDRWFTFPKFHQSSRLCKKKMQEIGLKSVKILRYTADGKTKYGDYIMPQAWDAKDATLEIILSDGSVKEIASYRRQPNSLFLYSAPTPPEGIIKEVVWIEDSRKKENYQGFDLKGKILFTSSYANHIWPLAQKFGAAGIIGDFISFRKVPKAIRWVNNSFVPRNKNKMFGFSILQEEGRWLKRLLKDAEKKGVKIKAKVKIKTKLYDGKADLVTGVIPGRRRDEEVLVFAHLYEIGAWDNASGCAAILESARCLNKLISRGILPKPKRSIRFMFGWEWYGLMYWLTKFPEKATQTVAGLTVDGVGLDPKEYNVSLKISGNPPSSCPSYAPILLEEITKIQLEGKWSFPTWKREKQFLAGDSLPADPCFAIPFPYFSQQDSRIWHTSLDTPDKLNPESLKDAAGITAVYLYFLANAGYREAILLRAKLLTEIRREVSEEADQIRNRILRQLEGRKKWKEAEDIMLEAKKKLIYLRDKGIHAYENTERLVSAGDSKYLTEVDGGIFDYVQKEYRSLAQMVKDYAQAKKLNPSTYLEREVYLQGLDMKLAQRKYKEPTSLERKLSHIIPERLIPGFLTLETLSERAKDGCKWRIPGYPILIQPILLTDGKRSLLEIARLMEQETGQKVDLKDLHNCYLFLEKYGYIRIERKSMLLITKERVKKDLKKIGLKKGDLVLVHSSLKSIGDIVGGPDTVIDAFLKIIGKKGTLMMPSFSTNFCRRNDPPFHPKYSPSRNGLITETFRLRNGAIRSKHPSHSVVAFGPLAKIITRGHEKLTPYSRKGPFGKLVDFDGYILFLGCGMSPNSTLHAIEDWAGLAYLEIENIPIVGKNNEIQIISMGNEPAGHRDFYRPDSKIERRLRAAGVVKEGFVGQSKVQLVSAKNLVMVVTKIMKNEPDILLCDKPNCIFCTEAKKKIIKSHRPALVNEVS